MGSVGWAMLCDATEVESFDSGDGNLVTGTFAHLAKETIDLVIEGVDPIGCTPNHPFWSVDRQTFVDAGKLLENERVLLYNGETKRVVSKLSRPGPELVYNFEVHGEHVYHVTPDGVLVHNSCGDQSKKLRENMEAAGVKPGRRNPDGTRQAAHHIVSSGAQAAEKARNLLRILLGKRSKVDAFNDASNGVFLTKKQHSGIHTKAYHKAVLNELRNATKENVREILADIAKRIRAGTFPH